MRMDPFPPVVDLFSGVLVVSLAGLILFTAIQKKGEERGSLLTVDHPRVRQEADSHREKLKQSLTRSLGGTARDCGPEDVCVDVNIEFERNQSDIEPGYVHTLQGACEAVSRALSEIPRKDEVELAIEGHTDAKQPQGLNPRATFLYNWKLSSDRAASVLYMFSTCGLKPPEYRILAVGYADSDPKLACEHRSPECDRQNRRTTFRVHADTRKILARMRTGEAIRERISGR